MPCYCHGRWIRELVVSPVLGPGRSTPFTEKAMSRAEQNNQISYIEFLTKDISKTKEFYSKAFGWSFKDWGPDYISFSGVGVNGGFQMSQTAGDGVTHGPLVVLYAKDLKAAEDAVVAAGGKITTSPFAFPGGKRFHFSDGLGNQLAVWSE